MIRNYIFTWIVIQRELIIQMILVYMGNMQKAMETWLLAAAISLQPKLFTSWSILGLTHCPFIVSA